MNTKILRRGTAAAAVLTMSLTLAACGEEDEPATGGTGGGTTSESSEAPSESMESEMPSDTESEPMGGDDQFAAVFGDACSSVPTDGEGSLTGMVDDPVATAASNNPLLKTLVAAVGAAQLVDPLNTAEALTVFAPADPAFEAVPKATLNELLAGAEQDGPQSQLATILSHHVVAENLDPTAVVGEQDTLAGDTLTVEGDPESGMTVSDGTVTANVLCGGVPTANATVYVIDSVLTGVQAG